MSALKDETGNRHGRLVVVERDTSRRGAYWWCQCDCGNRVSVWGSYLRAGLIQSCNCLRIERTIAATRKHGMRRTRTYTIWCGIIRRCTVPKCANFAEYGGRGIGVSPEWRSFEQFYADMGEAPEDCQIDRVDNDKGYCATNCRWVSRSENCLNTRRARWGVFRGSMVRVSDVLPWVGPRKLAQARRRWHLQGKPIDLDPFLA